MEKYGHKNLLISNQETNWPIGYARDEESAQRFTDWINSLESAKDALWERVQKLERQLEKKENLFDHA